MSESATATIELSLSGVPVQAEITVPTGPTRPLRMIPIFHALADTIVEVALKSLEQQGVQVSCREGCGACCRQLVPIAPVEALRLRNLINDLPEPRRSTVRARFADARLTLRQAGLLEKLRNPEGFSDDELRPMGLEYFRQGIPCPFLEREACSIYADRPVACREYLVTSPAEHCADPSPETVHCVRLAAKVSTAVARMGQPPGGRFIRWVPMVLADERAETHHEEPSRPGPELLQELFDQLLDQGREPKAPIGRQIG
jgi:Fe-S-cluster containining protein